MGTDKSQLLIERQTFTERIAETLLASHRLSHYRRPIVRRFIPPNAFQMFIRNGERWVVFMLRSPRAIANGPSSLLVICRLLLPNSSCTSRTLRLDHDAVVPVQQDGRPQPLAALYRVDPCLQRATELIEAGHRRPLDLLEAVKTRWVAFDEIRNLDQAERFFVNINTPEDYHEAIRGHSL